MHDLNADLRDDGDETFSVPRERVASAVRRIVAVLQDEPGVPPTCRVEPSTHDGVSPLEVDAIDDAVSAILGAEAGAKSHTFAPLTSGRFPILQALHRKYASVLPPPRHVRIDGEDDYAAFRAMRCAPYIDALEDRITALEGVVLHHVSDDHAGRLAALEDAFARHVSDHVVGDEFGHSVVRADTNEGLTAFQDAFDMHAALSAARTGGTKVPLSLSPRQARAVDCWIDGDEILSSVRVVGLDGTPRILTTGTPVARHVEPTTRLAMAAGVDPVELVGVFEDLVGVVGGRSLLPQIAVALPTLLKHPKGSVAKVTFDGDPALSAAFELAARAERGDRAAHTEAERVRRAPGGAKLMTEAGKRLAESKRGKPSSGLSRSRGGI